MSRLLLISAGISAAIAMTVGIASAGTHRTAKAPANATVTIRHQLRGCHSWSVNGGAYSPTQKLTLARGGTVTFVNNDVMPQRLYQKSGPAVAVHGDAGLGHPGASVAVVFKQAGVYRFGTKPGEDYVKGIKTIGEDNVLRLTVTVS
jgi:plastocyanin